MGPLAEADCDLEKISAVTWAWVVLVPLLEMVVVDWKQAPALVDSLAMESVVVAAANVNVIAVVWYSLPVSLWLFHCPEFESVMDGVLANHHRFRLEKKKKEERKELVPMPSLHPHHFCSNSYHLRHHNHRKFVACFGRKNPWRLQRVSRISCCCSLPNYCQGFAGRHLAIEDSNERRISLAFWWFVSAWLCSSPMLLLDKDVRLDFKLLINCEYSQFFQSNPKQLDFFLSTFSFSKVKE